MVSKDVIKLFLNKRVGVELGSTFYKGIAKKIDDDSLIIEMLNGKTIAISISEIKFIKEVG